MTKEAESLITDEMRARIGVESKPSVREVTTTGIRAFARAVGYTNPLYYDEDYAKSKGHRGLVAPPGYLGTGIYNPQAGPPPLRPDRVTTRPILSLNGGTEYVYTGVEICAGDLITSVSKMVSLTQRESNTGTMVVSRSEGTHRNQNGEIVAYTYGAGLQIAKREE